MRVARLIREKARVRERDRQEEKAKRERERAPARQSKQKVSECASKEAAEEAGFFAAMDTPRTDFQR